MQTKFIVFFGIGAVVVVLGTLLALGAFRAPVQDPNTSVSNAGDAAVRSLVTEFGSKLKNVSLLASDAGTQIATQYGPYITPSLLSAWQSDPSRAPGRQTSSPWPDKLDVVSVTPNDAGYDVEGNVIEVASGDGGLQPVAVYPVSMEVSKQDGKLAISSLTKGAYSELPAPTTITGMWECLPHKDKTGPQTDECAIGLAKDQSDGHYGIDTHLLSQSPVDFPTGTHVRVTGIITPVSQLNSMQKYDIDGIISVTKIEKI